MARSKSAKSTVAQLRERLSELGQSTSGNKPELLKRLSEVQSKGGSCCPNCITIEKRVVELENFIRTMLAGQAKPTPVCTPLRSSQRKTRRQGRPSTPQRKQVALFLSSHGRNVSSLVNEEGVLCTGYVKPGAPLREILRESPSLSRDADTVVIVGGTNDISRTGDVDFKPLLDVLKRLKTKRVIVSPIPPRYDDRRLNWRTELANRKLKELSHQFGENVLFKDLFAELERQHFTRHGLHMNAAGKRLFAKNIAKVCCV